MATPSPGRFSSDVYRFDFHSNLGVIESHQHLSEPGREDRTFGWANNDIGIILEAMDRCGVEAAILQPLGGANDPIRVHRMIHDYSQEHPGRIFGIASLNIKEYGEKKTVEELEHCIQELGFVGIKFHGFSHGINPMSPLAQVYFDTALALGVPLMVCVGAHGQRFTNPSLFDERAHEYPNLKIVFAHMDYVVAESLIACAARHPNIYLSTSLSIIAYLRRAMAALGGERIILASEDAASIPAEIAKVVFASQNDDQLRQVLRTTAIDLFGLRHRLAST
ncbi:MAG: amidohydrolase family protein [Planctomycetota bacterium]